MNVWLGFEKLGIFKLMRIKVRIVVGTCRHTSKLILPSAGCKIGC